MAQPSAATKPCHTKDPIRNRPFGLFEGAEMKKEESVLVQFCFHEEHEGWRGIVAFSLCVGTPPCTLARASTEADRSAADLALQVADPEGASLIAMSALNLDDGPPGTPGGLGFATKQPLTFEC